MINMKTRTTLITISAAFLTSCSAPSGGPIGSSGGSNSSRVPSWSIQYEGPIVARGKNYHIVDMYDVSSADIGKLKSQGTKVIAYFSSQYESWRNDASQFPKRDIGASLDGWKGENWINPNSAAVRAIMLKRLDYAKSRGFYGVDVDNVDFYEFRNGFGSDASDAVNYVKFLANAAHARGLKFGLKNAVDIIPATRGSIDYYVNEQAHQYDDLAAYRGLSKPVFNIEYRNLSKGTPGMYTIYKSGAVMDAREVVVPAR